MCLCWIGEGIITSEIFQLHNISKVATTKFSGCTFELIGFVFICNSEKKTFQFVTGHLLIGNYILIVCEKQYLGLSNFWGADYLEKCKRASIFIILGGEISTSIVPVGNSVPTLLGKIVTKGSHL